MDLLKLEAISVDLMIVAIVLASVLLGLIRGFLIEAVSLGSLAAGLLFAFTFRAEVAAYSEAFFGNHVTLGPFAHNVIGFSLIFVGLLVISVILERLASRLVNVSGFTKTDKALGMGFGLIRGVLLVTVLVVLLRPWLADFPWWQESGLIAYLLVYELEMRSFLAHLGCYLDLLPSESC